MKASEINLQPIIKNELVRLQPLDENDFEKLFSVASDPLIWEQHPNKDRYKRAIFLTFFKGAIESKGAFLIYDSKTEEVIGSSRFYDFDDAKKTISIGYTFYARRCWGTSINKMVKTLMLNHAFQFVDHVTFHIGAKNIRSQKAIEKLGAQKIGQQEVAYYGESENLNFIYSISKTNWTS